MTMVYNCLAVGIGGCIGSLFRYGLSFLSITGLFPAVTLCINFAGAVIIGAVSETTGHFVDIEPRMNLFLKTGFCGGFTTFSTFSLEVFTLLEKGRYVLGCTYIVASVLLCMLGVLIGKVFVRRLITGVF